MTAASKTRTLATLVGLGLVLGMTASGAGGASWGLGGPVAGVMLLALLGGRFTAFASIGLAAVVLGVTMAAGGGRLSVPTAAVLGLAAVAYVVLLELAEALVGGGERLTVAALAGWVQAMIPVLAAALAGAVVLAALVVLPVPAALWLVVAAPALLAVAVLLAVSRWLRREPRQG